MVNKSTKQVVCICFTNGKGHDFRLFKESKVYIHPNIGVATDTGYQGLQKIHVKAEIPKKRSKKNPLTKEAKGKNRDLASQHVINENIVGMLKRFKIIADKYRNRRKRFGRRFNLIAGIYNYEISPLLRKSSNISPHLKNIYMTGELNQRSTTKNFSVV